MTQMFQCQLWHLMSIMWLTSMCVHTYIHTHTSQKGQPEHNTAMLMNTSSSKCTRQSNFSVFLRSNMWSFWFLSTPKASINIWLYFYWLSKQKTSNADFCFWSFVVYFTVQYTASCNKRQWYEHAKSTEWMHKCLYHHHLCVVRCSCPLHQWCLVHCEDCHCVNIHT